MPEPQFKPGETCDLHTRLNCHECSAVLVNRDPSSAYLDEQYHHDPINQLYAEQVAKGQTQPHDRGQQRHPLGNPGYCSKHLALGCERCIPDAT